MQCAHCGGSVPDGAATCPVCGAELTSTSSDSPFKRPGDIGADGFSLSEESVSPVYKPHVSLRCPACGAPMTEKAKFCTKCGATSPLCSDDAAQRLSGSGIRVNLGHAPAASAAAASVPPGSYAPPEPSAPYEQPAAASEPSASYEPPASYAPSTAYKPPVSSARPESSEPSASLFMRRLCGSPMFLVVTIFCTLWALLSLVNTCKVYFPLFEYIKDFDTAVIVIIPLCDLALLVCWVVGIWLLFGAAKSSPRRGFSTGGLTMILVTFIVSLSLLGLTTCYTVSQMIQADAFEAFAHFDELSDDYKVQVIGSLGSMVIGLVLQIIFQLKIILAASATARTVRYNTIAPIPSAFVGVFLILSGVVNLLSPDPELLFMAIYSGHYFDYLSETLKSMEPMTLLVWVLGIVSSFLLGSLVFFGRKKWRACLIR